MQNFRCNNPKHNTHSYKPSFDCKGVPGLQHHERGILFVDNRRSKQNCDHNLSTNRPIDFRIKVNFECIDLKSVVICISVLIEYSIVQSFFFLCSKSLLTRSIL